MSALFNMDNDYDYIPSETEDTFDEIQDNASTSSTSRVLSTPSTSSTITTPLSSQPHMAKKPKIVKRQYYKSSWVWKYMRHENEYDICQVPIINMQDEEEYCG